jgi:sigma-54 dependent transcriptional regulator, acetoin dehydrogenase operon transcriptional activator AcoR
VRAKRTPSDYSERMSVETETMELGGAPSVAPSAGLVLLFAPDGARVPAAVVLSDDALVLGREPPPGGVALPFSSVSRVHARIFHRGAEIVVEDLESRNGTFVGGARVDRAFASHGDEIRIGEVLFKLVASGIEGYQHPFGPASPALEGLRGGPSMEAVRREILRIARADLSVLVLGETGSGKEVVATALHRASGRPGRLATVNCAAIPANLLESELFGYKRGAFTGADRDRMGIVKSADGGTLFLDEIGDMPLDAQAKVLRMLETRQVTPLGSHVSEPVDVRIVSATHRPLPRFVAEERFRGDLFARIAGHTIALPPLRERKEDLPDLVRHFLDKAGGSKLRVTPAFMLGMLGHAWPFNVRELEAAIKRAVALADDVLDERHLPVDAGVTAAKAPNDGRSSAPSAPALRALLERHGGNVAAVARELGKDRAQIHRWLKHHALVAEAFRK